MTKERIKLLLESMKICAEEVNLLAGLIETTPGLAVIKNTARELVGAIETALSRFEDDTENEKDKNEDKAVIREEMPLRLGIFQKLEENENP